MKIGLESATPSVSVAGHVVPLDNGAVPVSGVPVLNMLGGLHSS